MIKLYLRIYWLMYFYQRTHPLVTPGVWICGLVMLIMWVYNLVSFAFGFYKG